jgi:hypothetical protein
MCSAERNISINPQLAIRVVLKRATFLCALPLQKYFWERAENSLSVIVALFLNFYDGGFWKSVQGLRGFCGDKKICLNYLKFACEGFWCWNVEFFFCW